MKVLKTGEAGRKETIVDAKDMTVECHHTSSHASLPKGARFQCKWTFNFNGVPMPKILQAAAEYCVIAKRREMAKVSKPENDDWDNIIIDPADLIPTKASKAEKARKMLAGFSAEELAEMGISFTPE